MAATRRRRSLRDTDAFLHFQNCKPLLDGRSFDGCSCDIDRLSHCVGYPNVEWELRETSQGTSKVGPEPSGSLEIEVVYVNWRSGRSLQLLPSPLSTAA